MTNSRSLINIPAEKFIQTRSQSSFFRICTKLTVQYNIDIKTYKNKATPGGIEPMNSCVAFVDYTDWAYLASVDCRIFNFTFNAVAIGFWTDLAKINIAWPCKDLKFSHLQANGVLAQSI